jgi:hypothetical protein
MDFQQKKEAITGNEKINSNSAPKRGPLSRGLNIKNNTVKVVRLEKKFNGSNRQSTSKRS